MPTAGGRISRKSLTCLLCVASACSFLSCDRRQQKKPLQHPATTTPAAEKTKQAPRFRSYQITTVKELLQLRESLGARRFEEALKLNRIDLRHARQGDSLVVPVSNESWLDLSPFPKTWKGLEDQPKLIAVSLRLQAWAAYEDGQLVRWGPVSSGREASPTFTGLYHTNWCQKERRSTFNDEWLLKWYINLDNGNGISFHQYELPGYPDSHACVRLAADDSEWIYYWCRSWVLSPDERMVLREGTPVVVFGDYAWAGPRPWTQVIESPSLAQLTPKELAEALRMLEGKTVIR